MIPENEIQAAFHRIKWERKDPSIKFLTKVLKKGIRVYKKDEDFKNTKK